MTHEEHLAKRRARRAENAERDRLRQRAWRAANPDKGRAAVQKYRATNPNYKAESAARSRAFRARNPGYYNTPERKAASYLSMRKGKLRRAYGLTLEDFNTMLESQQHKCAICSNPIGLSSSVDHDHDTGKIRGILCGKCNTGLGSFQDSSHITFRAANYLLSHGKS